MRRFALVDYDMSVSPAGPRVITWGIEWPDGVVAYHHPGTATSVTLASVGDVTAHHGDLGPRGDLARLVWLDTPEGATVWEAAVRHGIPGWLPSWQEGPVPDSPNVHIVAPART